MADNSLNLRSLSPFRFDRNIKASHENYTRFLSNIGVSFTGNTSASDVSRDVKPSFSSKAKACGAGALQVVKYGGATTIDGVAKLVSYLGGVTISAGLLAESVASIPFTILGMPFDQASSTDLRTSLVGGVVTRSGEDFGHDRIVVKRGVVGNIGNLLFNLAGLGLVLNDTTSKNFEWKYISGFSRKPYSNDVLISGKISATKEIKNDFLKLGRAANLRAQVTSFNHAYKASLSKSIDAQFDRKARQKDRANAAAYIPVADALLSKYDLRLTDENFIIVNNLFVFLSDLEDSTNKEALHLFHGSRFEHVKDYLKEIPSFKLSEELKKVGLEFR